MENIVNYILAIKFINLSYTEQDERNSKNKAESRKMGLQFFKMYFDSWISVILSQNVNHGLILDHL